MTDHLKAYAQYMADSIDASIYLSHANGITLDEACDRAPEYLHDHGWCGRKYPLDFFRMDTVPTAAYEQAVVAQVIERAEAKPSP